MYFWEESIIEHPEDAESGKETISDRGQLEDRF